MEFHTLRAHSSFNASSAKNGDNMFTSQFFKAVESNDSGWFKASTTLFGACAQFQKPSMVLLHGFRKFLRVEQETRALVAYSWAAAHWPRQLPDLSQYRSFHCSCSAVHRHHVSKKVNGLLSQEENFAVQISDNNARGKLVTCSYFSSVHGPRRHAGWRQLSTFERLTFLISIDG